MRQLEFGLFDMLLHAAPSGTQEPVLALLERVRAEVAVNHPPEWNRFPHQFSHIFAGGYAARQRARSAAESQALGQALGQALDETGVETDADLERQGR